LREPSAYLSVIIPACNEEPNLSTTLQDVAKFLEKKDFRHEIIIVDDGSKDRTSEIAAAEARRFDSFILLKNPANRGKGYSVKRGVLESGGEIVLFMDADNSTRINQIEALIAALKAGFDVAIGSRRLPGAAIDLAQPISRRILGNTYIWLSKWLLGATVQDFNCGFKLFKKEAAKSLFPRLTSEDWTFDSELIFLISKLGLKLKEVPVRWHDIRTSKVKPIRDGVKSLWGLLKIRLNRYD
jgi:glycosyltransferase involved in cell wall biosynthesis